MAKSIQVELAKFRYGTIADEVSSYNLSTNYYEGAKQLTNFIVNDIGIISRRLPLEFLLSLNNEYKHSIEALEDNDQIILLLIKNKLNNDSNPLINERIIDVYQNDILINNHKASYTKTNTKQGYEFFTVINQNSSIYLFSQNSTYKLNLKNNTSALEQFKFKDGPYLELNTSACTITALEAHQYQIKIRFSDPQIVRKYNIRGQFIRVMHKGVWAILEVFSQISENDLMVNIHLSPINLESSSNFKGSVSLLDLPTQAAIYFGRMFVAYNKNYIAASVPDDFNVFTDTTRVYHGGEPIIADIVQYSDGFNFSIPSGKKISWITNCNYGVLVAMQEGMYLINTLKNEEKLSALNYNVSRLFGVKCGKAFTQLDDGVVFANLYSKALHNLAFSSDKNVNLTEINTYCQHLFTSRIKKMLVSNYNAKIIWILLENGCLISATVIATEEGSFYSFSDHKIGGENALILDIACAQTTGSTILYCVVNRKHNNISNTTLEQINLKNTNANICYLDGIQKFIVDGNIISGLDYYNNSNVSVVIDNIHLGIYKVVDNKIHLADKIYSNKEASIGYNYNSEYATPAIDYNKATNNLQTFKQILSATIRVINSNNFMVYDGIAGKFLTSVNVEKFDVQNFSIQSTWQYNPSIKISQNLHYPLNIAYLKLNVLFN